MFFLGHPHKTADGPIYFVEFKTIWLKMFFIINRLLIEHSVE